MPDPPRTDRNDWFCQQVQSYLPELYATARRFTRNSADAEDLVADSVASAWIKLDSLNEPDAFRGWMYRILTNTFISQKRKRDARPEGEPLDEQSMSTEAAFSLFEHLHQPFLLWWSNPEKAFLRRLLREDLESAVDALPEDFRMAIVLCDLQGFTYREIAELLDVPIGTVKSRLSRGRSLLQKALWAHARDAGLRRGGTDATTEQNHHVAH